MPRDPREQSPIPTEPVPLGALAAETRSWLIREARFLPDNKAVLEEFCTRIARAGVPLDRVSLHQRTFHPEYRGAARIWRHGQGIEDQFFDHGIERTAIYLKSVIRAVMEGNRSFAWRLDGNEALPYTMLEDLRDQGYTHYAIAPMVYTVGIVNAFSWATKRPDGFNDAEMRFFGEVMPEYAAVAEIKALRRFVGGILTTYVGAEAGRLILHGQVQRGDLRTITAALMLVDLRDFTTLSDRLSSSAVIRSLNQYFDCVMPPVRAHGGEVVEIMGDGVLAIFNRKTERDAAEACQSALAAAGAGLAALAERNRKHPATPLQAGVALHYGSVAYGNIGSGNRLDFTVIGPDVNLTSRIERLCRELDRSLIMSQEFAERLHQPIWEIGHFELRGFAKMRRLFELPPT
ncbi:MAG: adenylate/guanylate cyclase domain-containing protein [Stellaceae bacterium]